MGTVVFPDDIQDFLTADPETEQKKVSRVEKGTRS